MSDQGFSSFADEPSAGLGERRVGEVFLPLAFVARGRPIGAATTAEWISHTELQIITRYDYGRFFLSYYVTDPRSAAVRVTELTDRRSTQEPRHRDLALELSRMAFLPCWGLYDHLQRLQDQAIDAGRGPLAIAELDAALGVLMSMAGS